ncbi:MAG: STT3 domain-containing protein [Thermoplasmata archaeon]
MAMETNEKRGREGEGRDLKGKLLTALVLLGCFVLAMVIRCVWYYEPAVSPTATYGEYSYVVSGNDPDYHKRSIDYIVETGHQLTWDPLMNYPTGGPNPNPPAFAWTAVLLGYLLTPFYSFDVTKAVWMFFEILPAFWAAMSIFPIYYFTRDMFGRKPAYFAAFFIAVMAGNVERTPLGFSDHDSYVVFFVVLAFFFLMRAMKNLEDKYWVKSWRKPAEISRGLVTFFENNRVAVCYSVLAGFSIAAVMLGWKGGTYIFAILFMYLFIHSWIKRVRREDTFGIAILILTAMFIPLLVSLPYYYTMYFIHWYETPFFVFGATALYAGIIVVTRDQPYILVAPGLAGLVGGVLYVLSLFPSVWNVVLGFQGYFIRTKLYETIAEAQPPDFSRMVYSYGEWIFYFALVAIIYLTWRLPKERWRNDYIFTLMWCFMAIFMAMSAVRFMYNATPVFAILGGWVTWTLIHLLDFKKVVKTYKGLSGGGRWHALKSSVKLRHVVGVIFVGVMVIGSATWYGVDAGIPYETKRNFDRKIYDFLPSFLHPPGFDPNQGGTWWFGSFGTAFPSDSWIDAMFWFREQDRELSPEDRPAFVAWWDYGHWCMHMGEHPSIADNFQQGVEISGNIITSQNESSAIAYFIARVTEGATSDAVVRDILTKYLGEKKARDFIEIEEEKNLDAWKSRILKNSELYGFRTSDMNRMNTKWVALRGLLTSTLTQRQLVEMYDELMEATGHQIRYFAGDYRMFPFSATNTGIYYAPVKLTDQEYSHFLKVTATGNDGIEYDPAKIPLEKRRDPDFKITGYNLYYQDMFYNSLFYKAYIGYGPRDVGISPGSNGYTDIPSLVGNMRSGQYPPMQGWNMSNFRLEYRTSYWNPYNESTGVSERHADWRVIPPWTAESYKEMKKGSLDQFYRNLYGGVFFLKYYHGAWVNGTVTTDTGEPVVGARVTVFDDVSLPITYYPGIPHGYTFTDARGRYSLLAPYGNVTIKVTNGGQEGTDNLLLLTERHELSSTRFYISDDQAMRREIDLDLDGIPDYNIRKDFVVNTSRLSGRVYYDINGDGSFTPGTDDNISCYVRAVNETMGINRTSATGNNGTYEFLNLTPGGYNLTVEYRGLRIDGGSTSFGQGANETKDISFKNINLNGTVTWENGTPAGGVEVAILGPDGSVLWSNLSTENGSYMIERVLPGSYNASLISPALLGQKTSVIFNQSDNTTLNITTAPLLKVSGRVSHPGALISLQNMDNISRSVTVRSGPDGTFEAWVARGNHTVLARLVSGSDVLVALDFIHPTPSAPHLELSLENGIRLNGTVYRDLNGNGSYDVHQPAQVPPEVISPGGPTPQISPPECQPGATVEVWSARGRISIPCNNLGYFEVYLPAGNYSIRAYKPLNETDTYTNTTRLELSEATELNLSLMQGVRVSGTVFWDRNSDEVTNEGEAVEGAAVVFEELERAGRRVTVFTNETGAYRAFLAEKTNYTVSVSCNGYLTATDFLTTGSVLDEPISRNFKLDPARVPLRITFLIDGTPAPAGVTVYLDPASSGAQALNLTTDNEGSVSAPVIPGKYIVRVEDESKTWRGEVNLSLLQPLEVWLGNGTTELALSLKAKVKLSGVVYQDENGDGVAQKAEHRNALIKFIPEELVSSADAFVPGVSYLPGVTGVETSEGRYEVLIPPGNYTVWTLLQLSSPQTPDLVFLERAGVERTGPLNISLRPGCTVRGMVYVDLNHNGRYDSGENRQGIPLGLFEPGNGRLATLSSDPDGWYEAILPRGAHYGLAVENYTNETLSEDVLVPIMYLASVGLEVPDGPVAEMNVTLERRIETLGRVHYDRNANEQPDAEEGVEGAELAFEAASGARFTARTNETGNYSIYLEEGSYDVKVAAGGYAPEPNGTRSVRVGLETRTFELKLEAINLTLSIHVTFSGSGRLTSGAFVSLFALDGRGENASSSTDRDGRLVMSLRPGVYALYAKARVDSAELAALMPLELEPSSDAVKLNVPLEKAVRVWGSVFLSSEDGVSRMPERVRLSFNASLEVKGANRTVPLELIETRPVYELHIPPANYTVEATYVAMERGLNVTYNSTSQLNISKGETSAQWDTVLRRVDDHSVSVRWDETQKATIEVNGTVNYTVELSNTGNKRATFELEALPPSGWEVNLSERSVSLDVGASAKVMVGIRASAEANAGDNFVTFRARSSELPQQFSNQTSLIVRIVQIYGVELKASTDSPTTAGEEAGMLYKFMLVNRGNGFDTFNLTVSGPHGWTLRLSDYNPTLGAREERELTLTAVPFEGARVERGMTALVKANSKNEMTPTAALTINLTFPEITLGNFRVSGPGVSETSPKGMPGFEALGLVSSLAAAALLLGRRRRWAG